MSRKITSRTISRMRSPPRIISLAGDVGESSPLQSIEIPLGSTKKPQIPDANPRIINSVVMRPEASTDIPSSLYTSVLTLPENEISPRVVPPKLTHDKLIAQSKLQINSNSRTTATLDSKPSWVRDPNILIKMTTKLRGDKGLAILPGQTIVTRLNQHRDSKGGMRCFIEGDQAVRLTQLDEGGGLISDVDLPPHALPFSLEISQKSTFLTLTGLGGHPDVLKTIKPGTGAVTLTCSTDNTVATGFHPLNRVVVVIGSAQLCRGGVICANGNRTDKNGWITAEKVLKSANQVSLQTSSSIDTILIIYRNSETPQINAVGIDVVGEPHTVKGENLNASLWGVKSNDKGAANCTITVQTKEEGSIHSIVAARGTPKSWINTVESCDWSTIVEEGAISNHGKATIRIDVPVTPISTEIEEKKPPVSAPKPKKDEKIDVEMKSIFNLGELEVSESFERDVSRFAADDDVGDVLTFSKVTGPEFLSISSEGIIQGTPPNSAEGEFKFIVRVKDLDDASADATFFGKVIITDKNTAPYWKEDEGGDV